MKYILIILLFLSLNTYSDNICVWIKGQSNAVGYGGLRATLPAELVGNIGKSFVYNGSAFVQLNYTSDTNNFYPPSANGYWLRTYVYGVEMSLAYDLINNQGYDTVYICKYAVSSTWLYDTTITQYGSWNVGRVGDLYSKSKTFDQAALTSLSGKSIAKHILIYWQGESDSRVYNSANNYQTNLGLFIDSVRNYLPIDDIIIIELNRQITGYTYLTTVITALNNIAKSKSTHIISSTEYSTTDGVHTNGDGVLGLGRFISQTYCTQSKGRKLFTR